MSPHNQRQKMKKYIIEEELANAILNYLGSKPYVEVIKLIEPLLHLNAVEEDKKD